MRFVRMALRIPVIEAPVLKAIEEFLGLFSELVSSDHAEVRLHERVKRLKREVFDRAWPNLDWVDRMRLDTTLQYLQTRATPRATGGED